MNYPTGTYVFATTKKVELVFNFYDYQIKYQLNIIVQKKKIEIPKYIKEYEYSGKEISPTHTNKYYSTVADKGLNAGEYSITFEILDKDNYKFENEEYTISGKYKIKSINPKYTLKNGRFNFADGSKGEYFDEKSHVWKGYTNSEMLHGKVKMRVKDNKNYNEITVDFGEAKNIEKEKPEKQDGNQKLEKKGTRQRNASLTKGAIAGITVSLVAIIGIVTVVIIILLKKKKEKDSRKDASDQ